MLSATSCQRSVWLAHCLAPDSSAMYCAEKITFPAGVDVEVVRDVISWATASCAGLTGTYRSDGVDVVVDVSAPQAPTVVVAAPQGEAEQRALVEDFTHYVPRNPEQLQGPDVCAHLLFPSSAGVTWVIRAHHVAVDGFVMFSFVSWVIRCVAATMEGVGLPPYPFADAGQGDHGVPSEQQEVALGELERRWAALGAQESSPPVVMGRHPVDAVTVRARVALSKQEVDLFRRCAQELNCSEFSLLSWVVADYARGLTLHEGPVVVGMPQMNRALGVRPVCAPQVTVSPLLIPSGPLDAALLAQVEAGLQLARSLAGVPVEVFRARLPREDASAALTGPSINVRPFPARVPIAGGVACIDTLCVGPIDDVEVIYQPTGAGAAELLVLSQVSPEHRQQQEEVLFAHTRRLAGMIRSIGVSWAACPNPARIDLPALVDEEDIATLAGTIGRQEVTPEATMPLPALCRAQRARLHREQRMDDDALWWDGEWITWAEFYRAVDGVVSVFAAHGVEPGDRVALMLPRSPALLCAIAACASTGVVWVPVDPDLPESRRAYMAEKTAPRLWLVDSAARAEVAFIPGGSAVVGLDVSSQAVVDEAVVGAGVVDAVAAAELCERGCAGVAAGDEAYVLFTSGSTGLPKAVSVGQEAIANRLAWQAEFLGLDADSVLVQKTSCAFDVSVWEFLYPVTFGLRCAVAPVDAHRDPVVLGRVLQAAGVTVCHFVPSALGAALSVWERLGAPDGLSVVVTSGEALERHHVVGVAEVLGARVANFYGPTEAAIDVTACWADESVGVVPIGDAVWRTSALVVDDSWRLTPPGGVGRLVLGGVQVARGYVDDVERTERVFCEDPIAWGGVGAVAEVPWWARGRFYDTGDLARLSEDGLLYEGRRDGQVKLRGQRLELGEIVAQARAVAGCADAACVLREVSGQKHVCLYVVPAVGVDAVAAVDEVRAHLAEVLPAFMLPSVLEAISAVPLTVSGKLDRRALPPVAAVGAPDRTGGDHGVVGDPLTAQVCAVMAGCVGLPRMAPTANFFECGGTSLSAIEVAAQLSGVVGRQVAIADVFAHPCPQDLARCIAGEGDSWQVAAAEVLVLRPGAGGRPVVCLYPAGGLGWAYAGLASWLPADRPVIAVQAPGLVAGSAASSIRDASARAAAHVAELVAGGAYSCVDVVGWSVGGVIAQDLAATHPQLVHRVVLLDAYPAPVWRDVAAPGEGELLEGLLAMAGVAVDQRDPVVSFADAADRLTRSGGVFSQFPRERMSAILGLIAHHAQIMRAHETPFFDGQLVMLQAVDNPQGLDPRAWEGFASALVVHAVDTDHPGMVSPQCLRFVAEEVLSP
ncbi:AMP-binding protein [Corynebacterium aquilae]|uniref:Carrier domain-containing protein n=1 Tax=Corynebacterium aquilae DSM 44791 TaxID=1431546 RepID=A0A1L7CF36_9CORY|nr:AMP-binding protein [Corynebacterium aquilae]APT84446.1 hypothetical protein CAQU_04490 [Corynebacterium aquilae DSM 44791]